MVSTLIQLAGFGCLVCAAWLLSPVAGLGVAGVALLVIGHAADELTPRRKRKT